MKKLEPTLIAAFTLLFVVSGLPMRAYQTPATSGDKQCQYQILSTVSTAYNSGEQTEAFGFLGHIQLAEDHSSGIRLALQDQIQRLQSNDIALQAAALLTFDQDGRRDVASAPALIAYLKKPLPNYARVAAITALGSVGPGTSAESVQVLVNQYSKSGEAREAVKAALTYIRPVDTVAITPLLKCFVEEEALSSKSKAVAWYYRDTTLATVMALSRFGESAKPTLPFLIRCINSGETEKSPAILAQMPADTANAAVPALMAAYQSRVQIEHETANPYSALQTKPKAQLLVALGHLKIPKSFLPYIAEGIRQLRPGDYDGRSLYVASLRAAGAIGPAAAPLIPELIKAGESAGHAPLDHIFLTPTYERSPYKPPDYTAEDTTEALEAIRALGLIGAASSPCLLRLQTIADSSPGTVYQINLSASAKKAIALIQTAQEQQR